MNSKAQMLSMALLSLYISCMLLLFISNIWPLSTSVMLLHPSNPIVSEDIYILFPLKPYDNGLIPFDLLININYLHFVLQDCMQQVFFLLN